MESNSWPEIIGFGFLRRRLLELVSSRIGNGEFTERGFARMVGVSQPQIHNLLKGARNLSPETADLILLKLGISIVDLLGSDERHRLMGTGNSSPAVAIAQATTVGGAISILRKPPATDTQRDSRMMKQVV
jgi:transcriptional regulator with XRE-family HTH domain